MEKEATTAYEEKRTECPNSGDSHRYFIFKTETVYERIKTHNWLSKTPLEGTHIYEKVEYAILGCNCGSVIKERVKQ